MFLNPTAKPTPRRTPSPRVVLPAPPGQPDRLPRQRLRLGDRQLGGAADHLGDGQRPLESAGRSGARRPARARSAAAARPGRARARPRACPSAPRRRSTSARRRTRASRRRAGCSSRRTCDSSSAFATAYGPHANAAAFDVTAVERGRVRAAVEQDPHAHADELPVAVGAVLGPDLRRVPVHVADERLLAVVDHLHGPARVQREQRAVDLHREVLAPAERAADAGEVDAHALGLEAEARRDLVAVDVQPLRRDVDVDAALAVGDREPGLGAEERLVLDPELVDARDGHVAARVRVAVPDHEVSDDVRARVVEVAVAVRPALVVDRLLLHRALHVDDGLERLVLDADPLGGSARLLGVLGGDERDGLAEVAHLLDREHRLVGELEAVALLRRGRPRASARRARRARSAPRSGRSRRCARARAGCAACGPRASRRRRGRSSTRTRPSSSGSRRRA